MTTSLSLILLNLEGKKNHLLTTKLVFRSSVALLLKSSFLKKIPKDPIGSIKTNILMPY